MKEELKHSMIEYISDQISQLTYEVTAELAVLYATKMDKTYRGIFFAKTRDKFLKEFKYLNEETMYKILWSLLNAEQLKITDNSHEWVLVKSIIKERSKELSPKVISDILLLSTMEGISV